MNTEDCSCFRHSGGRSYCVGTKECDDCSCNGDIERCDFYPKKRQKTVKLKDVASMAVLNVDAIRSLAKDFKKPFISITINISEDGTEDNRA